MDCCIPLIKHHNAPFWGSVKCRYRALDQPFISIKHMSNIHTPNYNLQAKSETSRRTAERNRYPKAHHGENTAFSGRESTTPRCHKTKRILGPNNPSSLQNQWEMMLPSPYFVQASFPKFPLPPQHCTEISTVSQQKSIPSLRYGF